jgi:2-(1,2-epoxy-1,2-dihydrophenyl)acetyl-CoA isomerase
MTAVELTIEDRVAHVVFGNPPVNFFNLRLLEELAAAMRSADEQGARAVVLSSTGKHFCVGADFGAMGTSINDRAREAAACYEAGMEIIEQPLPIIAAVQGAAVGGGVGLACAADFRVASPSSRFELNFSRLGFHQGFALSATLPHIVGPQTTADLLYTSARVDGAGALRIGLVDELADDVVAKAFELAGVIAAQAPLAVRSIRETLRATLKVHARDVLVRELAEQKRLWATNDAAAGLRAAHERTTPVFDGT